MSKLLIFENRLKKIGIDIKMYGNMPWIYIDYINGKKVKEKFQGNHGFTIAFLNNTQEIKFTDLKTIFKLIRQYI